MNNLIEKFLMEGACLTTSLTEVREKLENIHAFIFDWDGVFNNGEKFGDQGSPFSEIDSMGTNLLRLGYWLNHDRKLPIAGVLTGAVNKGVDYFVDRECMDVSIRGFTNKRIGWQHFLDNFDIKPEQVAFVFDDVIDLPVAKECGLRFCVKNPASPAFHKYVVDNKLCDYVTANRGGSGAVREICEFILAVQGQYDEVVETRLAYAEGGYLDYLADRKKIETLKLLA